MKPTPLTDAAAYTHTIHTYDGRSESVQCVEVDFAQGLELRAAELQKENSCLRTMVAKANIPCAHCGLDDMSKCLHGFPGCAKADDILCGEDEAMKEMAQRIKTLRTLLDEALGQDDDCLWPQDLRDRIGLALGA